MKRYSETDITEIAEWFIRQLKELRPYIYHRAYKSNSIYIRFDHPNFKRSMAIHDHETITEYRYRYNFRLDCVGSLHSNKDGVSRSYFGIDSRKECVEKIKYDFYLLNGR